MTWTYDGDPVDPKDEIRYMVGDTNEATPLVQDEEITHTLTYFPATAGKPPWLAAAQVCDSIAAKLARKMQQSIGPLSAAQNQQYEHYITLAQQYRVLHATNGKGIVSGSGGATVAAAPILSGGGPTYLGGRTPRTEGGPV